MAKEKVAVEVSKMDAVRQIISQHGKGIIPTEIVKLVKKEFGADITPGAASNYKSLILKKQAEAAATSPPETKPAEPKPAAPKNSQKVNKMAAVREVIKKHGKATMPLEIVKLVKAEHAVEMSVEMASSYKSAALKSLGLGGVRGKQGRTPAAPVAASPVRSGGGDMSLEDIQAVKTLVDRMGAEKVGQLAGVLA